MGVVCGVESLFQIPRQAIICSIVPMSAWLIAGGSRALTILTTGRVVLIHDQMMSGDFCP